MFASKDTLLTRPSGYNIARSVRFRGSATSYFNRTWGTPTNNQIWTFSCWAKLGDQTNYRMQLLSSGITGSPTDYAQFQFIGGLNYQETISSATALGVTTSAVFRDPAAWYHVVLAVDTTQATATNRVKIYVNGVLQTVTISTQVAQNTNTTINKSTRLGGIGALAYNGSYINNSDGYQTESYFIDGQALTPSSFGETDSITGVWKPKAYSGTYGTNGFELNFSDNSNNTAATIGKDYSGNGNNWTPNNISVTAGVTYDSMTDVPTLTSATAANFSTFNPLIAASTGVGTITNGNLQCVTSTAGASNNYGTMGTTSGKWYWEVTPTSISTNNSIVMIGINNNTQSATEFYSQSSGYAYRGNGEKWNNGAGVSYGSALSVNDVIGVAFDADARTLEFFRNGTSMGTAYSSIPAGDFFPAICDTGTTVTWTAVINFGQRPFSYTPPTGFVALNTYNLPASTIKNGAAYMAATLYTGNASTQSIVNAGGFQPDFVWTKSRSQAYWHNLYDSVRGINNSLASNSANSQDTTSGTLTAFNSNGFSVGANDNGNFTSGATAVAWQWKAGGTSASNTNGSITSTVSAGATQGFSVVTYTGTGANATVGHGLGVAPQMIICKSRTTSNSWVVYHTSIGNTQYLVLNTTGAAGTLSTFWNNTSPTSTVFSLGSASNVNQNGDAQLAYCFSAVAGYSAFGKYTGNGSTDGTFVYTGFRPRFVMIKRTDSANNWVMFDTSRDTYNAIVNTLSADSTNSEATFGAGYNIDFLSNGFKPRNTTGAENASGGTYIYMAFAENPFKNALAR